MSKDDKKSTLKIGKTLEEKRKEAIEKESAISKPLLQKSEDIVVKISEQKEVNKQLNKEKQISYNHEVKLSVTEEDSKIDVAEMQKIDKFKLSFIEDHEVETAKNLIKETLGFEPPRVVGWQMAVKVYVRPEDVRQITTNDGRKVSIYLPEEARAHDKFVNCVGLVLSQGPLCYTGKYFEESFLLKCVRKIFGRFMNPTKLVPWCKVGDWVVFDRNAGPQINYRGVPVTILEDKNIRAVVECPSHVSRY